MVVPCILQISYKQHTFNVQHDRAFADFFEQQQDLLTRISRLVSRDVQARDQAGIQAVLSAYEGVLFSMQLPVGLQVVIINAPQQVIGLNSQLTPDDQFYTNVLQRPDTLSISDYYTLPAMPDYTMLSYGIAISNIDGIVLGILEAKVPETLLQEYLGVKYSANLVSYILQTVLLYILLTAVLFTVLQYVQRMKKIYKQEIDYMQEYITIQDKYRDMHVYKTNINVMQVIIDVYNTCKLQAHKLGINIEFTERAKEPIFSYCQQRDLYQVLLNILQNIICQLGANATIKIMVEATNENIVFKFIDDGYYFDLSQDWGEYAELVKYKHTTYEGNIITYSLIRVIKDNVVFMEQALETT